MLTPHFSWDEVERSDTAIRRRLDNRLPAQLGENVQQTARHLEAVRELLGNHPIRVTSWYRSPALNTAIGGSKTSKHIEGLAVDFQPTGLDLESAFERIAEAPEIPFDQLIIERTRDGARWIHLGFTTGTPRREVLRADGAQRGGPMTYTRVASG